MSQPDTRVEGEPFYSDTEGSVVDYEKLRRHPELTLSLRTFVTEAAKWSDRQDPEDQECASTMMTVSADGRAMMAKPNNIYGARERQRYSIALNIIALKLQNGSRDIGSLLPWLGAFLASATVLVARALYCLV